VLWARNSELAGLPATPPKADAVLLSGLMAGPGAARLPAPWRERARMTYPFNLPGLGGSRTAVPRAWLEKNKIPIVNEAVQIDTYVACAAMSESIGSLFDAYSRELLIERFEDMLGSDSSPGRYPRLGLAQGQRFASKGGYIVRFAPADGGELIAEGDWIVP
jgi:hypothetical protein